MPWAGLPLCRSPSCRGGSVGRHEPAYRYVGVPVVKERVEGAISRPTLCRCPNCKGESGGRHKPAYRYVGVPVV